MIKLQNLPQFVAFKSGLMSNPQKQVSFNNALERSPKCDSVNFTGKFEDPEAEEIFEINPEDVFVVPDEDIIVLPENQDAVYIADMEERMRKDEEKEQERRRQEDEDIINNDIIIYSTLYPMMIDDMNNINPEPVSFDDDIVGFSDPGTDFYSPEDDFSTLDDGFNDFGF